MAALSVFVFHGDTDLYALTLYRSGDNLPAEVCEGIWIYRARLLMTLDADAAIEDLKERGFFLARFSSGIITLPS